MKRNLKEFYADVLKTPLARSTSKSAASDTRITFTLTKQDLHKVGDKWFADLDAAILTNSQKLERAKHIDLYKLGNHKAYGVLLVTQGDVHAEPKERLQRVIQTFDDHKVYVFGDVIQDDNGMHYVELVNRISVYDLPKE